MHKKERQVLHSRLVEYSARGTWQSRPEIRGLKTPAWSADGSRPIHITCGLPNPEPWVSKSATNSPYRSAAVIVASCIIPAMRWLGGKTWTSMRSSLDCVASKVEGK
jgi:hypothetical protein